MMDRSERARGCSLQEQRSGGPGAALRSASVLAATAVCAAVLALALPAGEVHGEPAAGKHRAVPATVPATVQAAFEARVDGELEQAGLNPERLALLLYSTRESSYLYQRNIHRPMIAASNAKLATTYAALRVLSPDYRWRTRFYRVEEHDAAGGAPRQGLLVEANGDPTLTAADLQRVAWVLRSHGVSRLEGGLYFDGRRFDDVKFPASWGDVSKAEPWYAPVSPFIVDRNIIQFMIATRQGVPGFDIYTATPGFHVVSALEVTRLEKPAIRVEQQWLGDSATFTFQGSLAPADDPYQFAAAVERPVVHFYQQLRAALHRAGIQGAMPLRLGAEPPARQQHVHTELSPPLRDVLVDVNKNSSNLGAEVLLRTMGLSERTEGVSTEDGLAVLRRLMAREFPEAPDELRLVDGSGLSRENHVSALFLVRLLNRVRADFSLRPEYINSLSVALTDGTLQYRNFPWRLRGRLRAKTGTLAGVSNISGYVQLQRDVVVFSFLINDLAHHYLDLQEAQDKVVSALYEDLLAREAGEVLPAVPAPANPLPPRKTTAAERMPGIGVRNQPHAAAR
ncbi:MAG TPA: D-alanyl-D-alanine carboxypeptidase/D-alanyl-D-alanine-endopeptidase [bacterium]